MSGGHYDYAYAHVERFLEEIELAPRPPDPGWPVDPTPDPYVDYELRLRFKAHLEKVAAAMHAIEWNDSSDGAPRERELIKMCLGEP
jgi:hypothetical protein